MTQTAPASTSSCCSSTTAKQDIGSVCWWENTTRNAAASKEFYSKVFGWSVSGCTTECGEYAGLANNGRQFGGMMPMPSHVPAHVPSHWSIYVNVEDVDASLAMARTLGGTVVVEGTDIPQTGRFGIVTDPTGAAVCLFKGLPGVGCQGFAPDQGSFCWVELLTTDPAKSIAFYRGLFGWTPNTHVMGPMEYTTFTRAGCDPQDQFGCAGGMMKIPAEWGQVPSHWLSYISTHELESTVAKVTAAGGAVVVPPSEIPGVGRFSVITDTAGATVGLFSSTPQPKGCCGGGCGCG